MNLIYLETFLETILLAVLENSILPLCLSTKFKDKKKYTPFSPVNNMQKIFKKLWDGGVLLKEHDFNLNCQEIYSHF